VLASLFHVYDFDIVTGQTLVVVETLGCGSEECVKSICMSDDEGLQGWHPVPREET
jgi:prolyl-tRNA editing enzyme YbaK/EbsC (Cys-tRNA(Pro) deacylase)